MTTTSRLKQSQWDVAKLWWDRENQTVECVFRGPEWEPWVIVAESALMRRVGRRGLGLYAARAMRRDDYVGLYEGEVVGTYSSRTEALRAKECHDRVRRGVDKMITRNATGGGVELVDGTRGGPPFLHRINDPQGTRFQPNVNLTPGGYIRVVQAHIPPYSLDKSIEENIGAELRFSYGDEFWELHSRLGNSADYDLHVD